MAKKTPRTRAAASGRTVLDPLGLSVPEAAYPPSRQSVLKSSFLANWNTS